MPNAPLIGLVSTMENLPDIHAKDLLLKAFNIAINGLNYKVKLNLRR